MKLCNLNEDIPDEFYIFVNQMNPMTHHNFTLTKTFTSSAVNCIAIDKSFIEKFINGTARYLPFEPCQSDNSSPSPYMLSAINDYVIEYDAEVFREKNYPLYPSRLSALYAFGDLETCKYVSKKYGWPLDSVHKFRLKEWPLTRIVKVNMEHVSLAKHAYKVSMMQEVERLWQGYWSGFDEIILELPASGGERYQHKSDVIWEYLIEGIVECIE